MKRRTTTSLLLALLAAAFLAVPALGQQDMTAVPTDGFKTKTREAARFAHDSHNEKAGLADCTACHHGETKDGKRDMTADSAGTPCADCHGKPGRTPLMRAYHRQCMGCHLTQKKGPVTCEDCHGPAK